MYKVKKMTCLGVLDRGERGNDTEKKLKEGGGIEILTTVLHYAMLALFAKNTYHISSFSSVFKRNI